jgi:hypothetical protein
MVGCAGPDVTAANAVDIGATTASPNARGRKSPNALIATGTDWRRGRRLGRELNAGAMPSENVGSWLRVTVVGWDDRST